VLLLCLCVAIDCVVFDCVVCWSYGVMVSTLDSESSDPGSNPGRTSFCRMRRSTDTFFNSQASRAGTPIDPVDAISYSHVTPTTLAPALAASFRSASTGLQVRLRYLFLFPLSSFLFPLSSRRRWLIDVVNVVDLTQLPFEVPKKRAARQLPDLSNAANKWTSCAKETSWDTASRRVRQEVVGADTI
jgi:hypothetical protein